MSGSALGFPPFQERWPWRGGDLQTLRNTLRRPRVPLPAATTLDFPMDEGMEGAGDRVLGLLHQPALPATQGRPLVVLAHGLAGSADSVYIRSAAARVLAAGHAALRLHLRGAGPLAGHSRQRYHAGRSDDLRRVLGILACEHPALVRHGAVVVGYSLAGNQVLKLMGEADLPAIVRGAVAVSAPIDLAATSRRFLRPRNRVYHSWLLSAMKRQTLATPDTLLAPALREAVRRSRTIYEFDDGYVAPLHGWRDAQEYYAVNSARRFLPAIRVPTLVIHALDDPWIAPHAYQDFPWERHPALLALITQRGGHVGFHAPGGVWADACLERFLSRL